MSKKTQKIAQQKVGEKIIDLGNLALTGIVFAQFLPERKVGERLAFPLFYLE